MRDQYNREINYLRISVTDRCNLRCVYCMPEEGIEPIPHEEILTFDEIVRICRSVAGIGISRIKLTGGEPLVRKNVEELVREIKNLPGIEEVTMTTNGILLQQKMKALYEAGIDRINVSLDTLDPDKFHSITRRGDLMDVKNGIDEVLKYKTVMLKLNCVPMEIDRETVLSLVEMARYRSLHVRFIEVMPIGEGAGTGAGDEKQNGEDAIMRILTEEYGPLRASNAVLGNGPSRYYDIDGFVGKVGFISAVSHKFCDCCNRVRLTSDGYLKTCLQYDYGCDLKSLLRRGISDEELLNAITQAIEAKPREHAFGKKHVEHAEGNCMSRIGG